MANFWASVKSIGVFEYRQKLPQNRYFVNRSNRYFVKLVKHLLYKKQSVVALGLPLKINISAYFPLKAGATIDKM